jgi:hypothetical protein
LFELFLPHFLSLPSSWCPPVFQDIGSCVVLNSVPLRPQTIQAASCC